MADNQTQEKRILELPRLPLRNTVIFPSGISPLTVGRSLSLAAVEAALTTEEKLLGVIAQREDNETEATVTNMYTTGTLVVINRMMRAPGNEEVLHLIVQGQERFRVLGFQIELVRMAGDGLGPLRRLLLHRCGQRHLVLVEQRY